MPDRRYDEDEVREILARATDIRSGPRDVDPSRLSDGAGTADPGLTLGELQEVAQEVGIPPERIEEAATALELDRAALPTARRHLGVELATGHVVRLPRMPTEEEWDRFVVRLRDTFGARGEVASEGSLRTWSNGKLEALLEPLPQGARLRFTSQHGASKGLVDAGVALLGWGAVLLAFLSGLALLRGESLPWGLWAVTASLPTVGAGLWTWGRARAARWLPERRRQFRRLGAEAQGSVGGTE